MTPRAGDVLGWARRPEYTPRILGTEMLRDSNIIIGGHRFRGPDAIIVNELEPASDACVKICLTCWTLYCGIRNSYQDFI